MCSDNTWDATDASVDWVQVRASQQDSAVLQYMFWPLCLIGAMMVRTNDSLLTVAHLTLDNIHSSSWIRRTSLTVEYGH